METKGIIFSFFFLPSLFFFLFLLPLFNLLFIHGRNILERFMRFMGFIGEASRPRTPTPPTTPTPDPLLPQLDSDEDFHINGPRHMMATPPTKTIEIDWDNEEHHRCITACLVRDTYVLESEQTSKLREAKSNDDTCVPLAPAGASASTSACFACLRVSANASFARSVGTSTLTSDDSASSTEPSSSTCHWAVRAATRRLRGTSSPFGAPCNGMPQLWAICSSTPVNAHHSCGRFSHARENVREILNPAITNGGTAGSSCLVWLAGHSLGASIAMDMGRDIIMANNKLELPTFLFNPPHVSLTRAINDELPMAKVATTFVIFSSNILKHGLGKILKRHKKDMEEQFKPLSPWKPNLYVHQRDIICKGFINYFEQREGKGMWWWPSVAASGTTLSYWDMCCFVFGMQKVRPHLLPSAMLWVNQSSVGNPHELRQWWQPPGAELVLSRKEYEWSAPA